MANDRGNSGSGNGNPEEAAAIGRFAEAVLHTTQQPFLVLDESLKVEMTNPAFRHRFAVSEAETKGRLIQELGNGQWDIPELRELLRRVVEEGKPVEQYRVEHDFESIGHRVMLMDADLIDPDRTASRKVLLAISDITEMERLRWELEAQQEYSSKIVDAVRDPLLVLTSDLRVETANQPFYEAFRVVPEETEGKLIYRLGNGQWDIPRLRELLERILPESEAFDDFEVEHDFEEIGHRVMLLNARRIDHVGLVLLAIEDITERRQREQQQGIVAGELLHRIKNLLATIQSLLRQTRRHSKDLDTFVRDFGARLESVGRTQDLLLSGERKAVMPHDLLHLELDALGAREGQDFTLEGERVELPPAATQPLAMILHELTTNASKYGALSVDGGRVDVTWRVEWREGTDHFRLRWREHGVDIPADANNRGFGTEMIEGGARVGLRGSADLTLHPDGAECILEFPLHR